MSCLIMSKETGELICQVGSNPRVGEYVYCKHNNKEQKFFVREVVHSVNVNYVTVKAYVESGKPTTDDKHYTSLEKKLIRISKVVAGAQKIAEASKVTKTINIAYLEKALNKLTDEDLALLGLDYL